MLTTTETRAFQKKLKDIANRLKGDCSQLESEGPPVGESPADLLPQDQEGPVATGEVVTADELGGGNVHTKISGVSDHLA